MDESKADNIKNRRKKTKSIASPREISVGFGDQHLKDVTSTMTLKESGQTEILTEQNRLQASKIRKLEAASNEDQANFKAKLQECQSKVDFLESEKQTLLERIEILTEQNKRQAKFLQQVENVLSHPSSIVCILVIIFGMYMHCSNMASENRLLRERNGDLTEKNNRKSSRIEKLETDSKGQRDRFDIRFQEQKVKIDAMNSENLLLREDIKFANYQKAALTEENYRKSSRIEKLETDSKRQRDRFDIQLREQKVKLDAMNSENRLLRDQIAFASHQTEFLQSQMTSMRVDFKEKTDQITAVRLQENQLNLEGMNYLVSCLRDKDSASEGFAGISLFWGAIKVGRTTRSGLDNCLTMYQAHFNQRILL